MNKFLFLLAATTAAFIPTMATALEGRIFKAANGDIFVYGLSPGKSVTLGTQWASRRVAPDVCGQLIIRPNQEYPRATVKVNGIDYNPDQLPIQPLAKCNEQARVLITPRPSAYITSRGWIVLPGMPYTPHTIYYPNRLKARAAKANKCGIVQLKDLPRQPFASILRLPTTTGITARFTVVDLPTFLPPLCRKTALLVPPGWAPPLAQAVSNTDNETMEIGFNLGRFLQTNSSSNANDNSGGGSSGEESNSGGITGSIVTWPGWTGVSVGYPRYERIEAAKTPDNNIVIAELPTPSDGKRIVVGRTDYGETGIILAKETTMHWATVLMSTNISHRS